MDEATTTLARKLAAHPEFEWRAGMTGLLDYTDDEWREDPDNDGPYLVRVTFLSWGHYYSDDVTDTYHWNTCNPPRGLVPDLDDPPTWGAILAMLWEVWPDATLLPLLQGVRTVTGFVIYIEDDDGAGQHPVTAPTSKRGPAIAAALLDAWGDDA